MQWNRSSCTAFTPVLENAQIFLNLKTRIQSQKKANEGKKKGVEMFKHTWLTDRLLPSVKKQGNKIHLHHFTQCT